MRPSLARRIHSGRTIYSKGTRDKISQSDCRNTARHFSLSLRRKMPFAKVEGKDIHYTDHAAASNESAPTNIILIHGLGSTQNFYRPILPYLTKCRCITFDNYAAGRSRYVPDTHPETSVESIGKDVLGLLDHLKIDKAIIVGYSMGGMLPTHLASTVPSRVVAGVCLGPVNPNPSAAKIFHDRILTVRKGGMETMANSIPDGATGPHTTHLQKAFIREMILGQDPEGYCANCRAIETATPPAYEKVTCPMMVVAGEADKSAPLDGCQYIFDHLGTDPSKKEMVVLKDMGHWFCVEDGDQVGKLIQQFVDRVG